MPKLYVFDTQRKITTDVTIAFARGAVHHNNLTRGPWEVRHIPIQNYLDNGMPQDIVPGRDAVATLGILRGTGLMLKEAKRLGIDYYYMDHAYFNPGYRGKGWMRISKNGHSCPIIRDCDKDRFKGFHNNHGHTIEPWRTNEQRGDKILVLPPTNAVAWFFNEPGWEEKIIQELKNILPVNEHHRIVVRRKPKEPVVDNKGNLIELRTTGSNENPAPPIEQELEEAQCVIAYNSMVALQATMKGIPVITGENSPCVRISYGLESLAQPEVFDTEPVNRHKLVYWLAYNQWKLRDIENGTAWRMLQENYNGF